LKEAKSAPFTRLANEDFVRRVCSGGFEEASLPVGSGMPNGSVSWLRGKEERRITHASRTSVGCTAYDRSQNSISTRRDGARDWDCGSPREDEPPTRSAAYFANLRPSVSVDSAWSGSRHVVVGFEKIYTQGMRLGFIPVANLFYALV
jgi:hypothetical protein